MSGNDVKAGYINTCIYVSTLETIYSGQALPSLSFSFYLSPANQTIKQLTNSPNAHMHVQCTPIHSFSLCLACTRPLSHTCRYLPLTLLPKPHFSASVAMNCNILTAAGMLMCIPLNRYLYHKININCSRVKCLLRYT